MSVTVAEKNPFIPRKRLLELSAINTRRSLGLIALDWTLIVAAFACCYLFFNPVLYVLTVMFIANRQHSLLLQMSDAAHFRVAKNRSVNDWIGELLCAWPMYFRMAAYRESDLKHHRNSSVVKDPSFHGEQFPRSRKEIVIALLKDISGLNALEALGELKRLSKPAPRKVQYIRIAYYVALAGVITLFQAWPEYFLYWIVPMFTWLKAVLRLRSIADHAGVESVAEPFNARAVVPSIFDEVFIAPHGCSYHLGHHLYPSVPSYNLRALNQELMKDARVRAKARVIHGFHNLVFKEFAWDVSKPAAETAKGRRRKSGLRTRATAALS